MELFVLAMDHRNSLRRWYRSQWGNEDNEQQTITELKSVVVDAVIQAVRSEPALRARAGMLIDDEYGSTLLPNLREGGVRIITAIERSGRPEFEFEHGDEFARRIDELRPDMVKALVRYNVEGDRARNARSAERLVALQDALAGRGLPWILELLVPPEAQQLLGNETDQYDREVRPALTVRAIDELVSAGLQPDYWKVEGLATLAAFSQVAGSALVNPHSRLLVLGRGEDYAAVERWVELAGQVDGFAGFAIGRTLWEQPLFRWRSREESRETATGEIANRYLALVKRFNAALSARTPGDSTSAPAAHG